MYLLIPLPITVESWARSQTRQASDMTRCFYFYRDKPKTKHCLCGITLIQCDKCIIYYQISHVIAAWCSHSKTVFQDYLQNRHQPRAQARTSYNSPVSAIRRPRRDAVNIDIWFHAQNRLVFHLRRHLELISMDVMWVMFLSSSNLLLRASRFYRHWSVSDVSDASGTSLRITHHASSDLRMYGSTQYRNLWQALLTFKTFFWLSINIIADSHNYNSDSHNYNSTSRNWFEDISNYNCTSKNSN